MVLLYTVCDVELPNHGNFQDPGFLQGFIQNLILGLPYPGRFPYPFKYSSYKSAFNFEINNN